MPLAHKLLRGSLSVWRPDDPSARRGKVTHQPGDLIYDLTPEEIKEHAKRLELVNVVGGVAGAGTPVVEKPIKDVKAKPKVEEPEPEAPAEEEEEEFDWTDVLSGNVTSVKEYIAGLEDPEHVASLSRAEAAGASRKGVLTACEDKLAELSNNSSGEEA